MHLALFSLSRLDHQSIRAVLNQTVTSKSDSVSIPVNFPLAIINAFNTLKDNSIPVKRDFSNLENELSLIHISVLALTHDGTYFNVLKNIKSVINTSLGAKDGFASFILSGTLKDWKSDLTLLLRENTLILREFVTEVMNLFETVGINKSLLNATLEHRTRLYQLEKR